MTYIYKTNIGDKELKVEYVISSITNEVKVVDMWFNNEPHKLSYMSDENRYNLLDTLERHYLDVQNENEYLESQAELHFIEK